MSKPVKIPSPDHPITLGESGEQVSVHLGGRLVARTTRAIVLQEAAYPAVYYVPREDVQAPLTRTETEYYCPYKGEATFYAIENEAGDVVQDAAWSYEQPFDAVGPIAGHLAFYPEHATVTTEPTVA